MKNKRRVLPTAMLLFAFGCAQGRQHVSLGTAAPAFSEPTVTGTTLTMTSLVGRPVWLNFFATWCPPCNAEAPDVSAMQAKYATAGLQVVGVDVLESTAKARQFIAAHNLSYPAVVDSGSMRDAYNVSGMPVNVFIDKSGVVRAIEIGELSRSAMETDILKIL